MTAAEVHSRINTTHTYQRELPGQDAWQTPQEFDAAGVGDCEDFAIAYWYALQSEPGRTRLAVCRRSDNEMHMVCLYWDADGFGPWVLDVAADAVCELRDRDDLTMIFEFDQHRLYCGDAVRPASQMTRWADVLARIATQDLENG